MIDDPLKLGLGRAAVNVAHFPMDLEIFNT